MTKLTFYFIGDQQKKTNLSYFPEDFYEKKWHICKKALPVPKKGTRVGSLEQNKGYNMASILSDE